MASCILEPKNPEWMLMVGRKMRETRHRKLYSGDVHVCGYRTVVEAFLSCKLALQPSLRSPLHYHACNDMSCCVFRPHFAPPPLLPTWPSADLYNLVDEDAEKVRGQFGWL